MFKTISIIKFFILLTGLIMCLKYNIIKSPFFKMKVGRFRETSQFELKRSDCNLFRRADKSQKIKSFFFLLKENTQFSCMIIHE